jgi:hypothetical protein
LDEDHVSGPAGRSHPAFALRGSTVLVALLLPAGACVPGCRQERLYGFNAGRVSEGEEKMHDKLGEVLWAPAG